MIYIWFCIAWGIGVVVAAFLLLQPLIVLCFGIPFTMRLRRFGILRGPGSLVQYCVSLILLPLLFWAATEGMQAWLPNAMLGYWIGIALTVLRGLGSCGANETNVKEYLQSNIKTIDVEAWQRHFGGSL